MIRQPYCQLVEMKRWADRGLYEVIGENLGRLDKQETALLLQVLDHMHAVDQIFRSHLQGRPHSYRAAQSETLPEFQALADGVRETDDWYADYVRGLSPGDFDESIDFVFTSGKPARMRRGEILLHVCLHGEYHRGNAGAVLYLKGVTPSRDSVTDFLEDTAQPPALNLA
ncbi:DinB family protein [Phenylobacterium terrae]|uniref:DinB family protein n=1 Tax=Phenylobacterium terrae TaxID=2665495 RepID=A0ABW4MZ97_9CAUL